ncbi:MAG: tRNA 2-thiouridine(34) synthase MnmA [Myxococcales bacterium]|nr:tRNA 2-thiouridine(34) synthase MnmA [Myxococcota bacterium]MDW8283058.1 tRNA 2-thiouridine(34) synthase MnmA [Myxococcales bacterium]
MHGSTHSAAPIVVALSGGVDSATCAALLVEAGEPVVGIFMRLYDASGTAASAGGRCCGPRDLEDARAVCEHLGIPFYVANYEEAFREAVIDDFVRAYTHGRTPNPCVRCNERIKFLPLLRRARALGAAALCTGHYARIERDPDGARLRLLRAVDARKDQSYFLFSMPPSSLNYVRFPLGSLSKEQVRAHARRLGLPNADKPESQEICFVPDGDHAGFVARHASTTGGELVDVSGRVVGRHEGVHRFTIGQRRGIGVGLGEKLYVVRIEAATGRVYIGPREALARSHFCVEELHWLGEVPLPGEAIEADVQIRYRHQPRPARIEILPDGTARVHLTAPEYGVAPGQAAVFYRGDEVLGGGFIAPEVIQTT